MVEMEGRGPWLRDILGDLISGCDPQKAVYPTV